METRSYQVFTFDELPDDSKEKALNHWRQSEDFDSEYIIEDAAEIALLFGLDIYQTRKQTIDGGHIYKPAVHFSGFYSQGDGACFEGTYQYKKGALKAVKAHATKDEDLHNIVESLQELQRCSFYRLTASCKHRGHYSHSGCMQVEVSNCEGFDVPCSIEEDLRQCLRDFADWIYSRLKSEYDYQTSDEAIIETIKANEYLFTLGGEID